MNARIPETAPTRDPRPRSGWARGLGAVLLALGIAAIVFPLAGSVAAGVFLGALIIAGSILRLTNLGDAPTRGLKVLDGIGGVLGLAAGALLFLFPVPGILTLTLLVAAYFGAQGIVKVAAAISHSGAGRGWLGFGGVLDLVLAGLVFLEWPTTALWFLGLLLGVHLIINGVALLSGGREALSPPVRRRPGMPDRHHGPMPSRG